MSLDLLTTYLHLAPDGSATPVEVTPEFWATIDQRRDLDAGRLVMAFRFTESWPTWEMHPAGDEVVMLLAGSMDLILDEPAGERRVALRGRQAVVVPRGVWHTADVHEPSEALFLTPGEGTQNRPR